MNTSVDVLPTVFDFDADPDSKRFEWLFPLGPRGSLQFNPLLENGRIENWNPVPVMWKECLGEYDEDDKPPTPGLVRPDIANVGAVSPGFNAHALECLEPLIRDHVQVLPLECVNGEPRFLLHMLTVVDGMLNVEASEVWRVGPTKQLIAKTPVLRPLPPGQKWPPIFRIAEDPRVLRFVSDEFHQIVQANNLTGAQFIPIRISE